MDGVPFVKMHGLGNDFVVLDAAANHWMNQWLDYPALAREMCDRHTGVGADGLIVVSRTQGDTTMFQMRIFNADGSDGGMCGNGARCVAKMLVERSHIKPDESGSLVVKIGDRLLRMHVQFNERSRVDRVSVDMGKPVFTIERIPADGAKLKTAGTHEREFEAGGRTWRATLVSMGNPHAVIFVDSREALEAIDLAHDGSAIEHAPAFPQRTNAQFAYVESRQRVHVRTWERGAGATRACGSGACAVLAAGVLTGKLDRHATIVMPGGELDITWDQASGDVMMTGPAADVFTSHWPAKLDIDAIAAHGPMVRTSRLMLRWHRFEDAAAVRKAVSRFEVARYTKTIPHPYPLGAEIQFLERTAWSCVAGGWQAFAIEEPESGDVVGAIGVRREPFYPTVAEIGYHIDVDFWGKGYASEALRGLVDHLFMTSDLRKIHARWYSVNVASGRVLENAGFKHEGVLRRQFGRWGEEFDVVCVGLLKEEWEARRAR